MTASSLTPIFISLVLFKNVGDKDEEDIDEPPKAKMKRLTENI